MADFEAFQSDDVAIQLRAWGGVADSAGWDIEDGVPCEMLRQAADEIERLRAEINDLRLRLVALSIPKDTDRG